jgi:hypothetical protein
MKKIIFLFAMLAGVATNAQVTVVEPVGANYTTKTVSFRVRWNAGTRDATHLSKVWVWVDYIAVNSNNTVSGNSWTRALVSGTPTATVGTVSYDDSSRQGFWLQGNSGSYSATVTVRLNVTAAKFNWCAYASDFPPNAVESGGVYTLRGTPPFVLTTASGAVEVNTKTYSGDAITALADATGSPGILCGRNGEAPGVLNCCATGTTNCSGTCRTTGTYTQNDGACAGQCNRAYVRQFNQCGELMNPTYSTYTNTGCTTPNYTTNDGDCTGACDKAYVQQRDACGNVVDEQYATYTDSSCLKGCSAKLSSHCRDADTGGYGTSDPSESSCSLDCRVRANGVYHYFGYAFHRNGMNSWVCTCYGCN